MDDLIAALIASAAYLGLLGIVLRGTGQRAALPVMVGLAIAVLAGALALGGARLSFWHFSAFFGCGVVLIVFMYGAVLKSLSLEMLLRMAMRPDGTAQAEDLIGAVLRPAFTGRIVLLEGNGYAEATEGGSVVTETGRAMAHKIDRIRALLGLSGRGLYSG